MTEQLMTEQLGLWADDEPEVPEAAAVEMAGAEQLGLAGVPAGLRAAGAVPADVMRGLVADAETKARYWAKVWRDDGHPDACWFWTGALSSTGHGKLKAGPGGRSAVLVSAHVYGWALARGPIAARAGEDLVVAHRCDEASCQRPEHWEVVERWINNADYRVRRHRAEGPLADERGAAGRAKAIREAILAAQASGADVAEAVRVAQAAGLARASGLF